MTTLNDLKVRAFQQGGFIGTLNDMELAFWQDIVSSFGSPVDLPDGLLADTINESTLDAGTTVEGVKFEDGDILEGSKFFWDSSAGQLALGHTQSSVVLDIVGDDNINGQVLVRPASLGNDAVVRIQGRRNSSTIAHSSHLIFENFDDDISAVRAFGAIAGKANNTSTNIGNLVFNHFPDGLTETEAVRITSDGDFGLGNVDPKEKLDIRGAVLIREGDNSGVTLDKYQVKMGFDGSNTFSNFITTRHSSGSAEGNAISFWTSDGTSATVYPADVVHGITVENGKLGVGGVDFPGHAIHVDGDVVPFQNDVFDLGITGSRWNTAFINNVITETVVLTAGPTWSSGTGSPEGVVTATVGSMFSRTDGGAGTSFYVKESGAGNTGWIAK